MLPHQLELLAPARDADIGIEAINHGADAVYIGGPAYGARLNAANSFADIARLVAHARRFDARIFMTLNTIFRDDELEAVRTTAWQAYDCGVDALIVQDMGLLELDMPPMALHASTQTDIRTPEKARFLQDVGFSQLVMARELNLQQIQAIRAQTDPDCILEFFIHGALCVAYSGQCTIGEAHVGRSANRGECNQACRLPYKVQDAAGRFIAHDKHVLSMKDNDQSANLGALVDAGVRSFKIEGRYKDMGYVKNITGHYRKLIDALLEDRPELARASSGRTTLRFVPDPAQNFNRGSTDYFVNGRLAAGESDIGAFDTPKHSGIALGWVTRIHPDGFELEVAAQTAQPQLFNGDGLTYYDLQKELVGVSLNRVEPVGKVARNADGPSDDKPAADSDPLAQHRRWRVWPREPMLSFKDLRTDTQLNRNRDMSWLRQLEKPSATRKVGVWMSLTAGLVPGLAQAQPGASPGAGAAQVRAAGNALRGEPAADWQITLHITDERGTSAQESLLVPFQAAASVAQNTDAIASSLRKLGSTIYEPLDVQVQAQNCFIPASSLNTLRRNACQRLDAARLAAREPLPRSAPVVPPVAFPQDTLSYLGNVLNTQAHAFYTRHGVRVIEPAYEAHQELGEVSLMITKHCVRWSMSLCPKQAKGVTGVQGTVKAEPLMLINGRERLTLKFDCKPCEMHVVGKMKTSQLNVFRQEEAQALADGVPMQFYKTRPKTGSPVQP